MQAKQDQFKDASMINIRISEDTRNRALAFKKEFSDMLMGFTAKASDDPVFKLVSILSSEDMAHAVVNQIRCEQPDKAKQAIAKFFKARAEDVGMDEKELATHIKDMGEIFDKIHETFNGDYDAWVSKVRTEILGNFGGLGERSGLTQKDLMLLENQRGRNAKAKDIIAQLDAIDNELRTIKAAGQSGDAAGPSEQATLKSAQRTKLMRDLATFSPHSLDNMSTEELAEFNQKGYGLLVGIRDVDAAKKMEASLVFEELAHSLGLGMRSDAGPTKTDFSKEAKEKTWLARISDKITKQGIASIRPNEMTSFLTNGNEIGHNILMQPIIDGQTANLSFTNKAFAIIFCLCCPIGVCSYVGFTCCKGCPVISQLCMR